ncbi:MAG TPA: ArsB/NhaD family transporter, partial [Kamptonema sp.]|nr:ArsB/NhaD family transporter [Kamptonema sp.]
MSLVIFLLTLAIAIWRPRGLGIGFSALGGAIAALATGVATPENLPAARVILGNNTISLAALLALSWVLEQTGVLRWLALSAARWNLGRGRQLFLLLGLAVAITTALLTNCGATVIVTPFVFEIMALLSFSTKATFAFAFAVGFIADAASLPFISSNLVNTLAASYADISPMRYASVMLPVSIVAIAVSLAVLLFYLWPHIPITYQSFDLLRDGFKKGLKPAIRPQQKYIVQPSALQSREGNTDNLNPSKETIKLDTIYFDAVSGFSYTNLDIPLLPSATALSRFATLVKFLNSTPVQIILFSWGMYVIAIGLGNYGLTTTIGLVSAQFAQWGLFLSIISTGFLATILAAVTNNLPAAIIHAQAIQSAPLIVPGIREGMVYAAVIG